MNLKMFGSHNTLPKVFEIVKLFKVTHLLRFLVRTKVFSFINPCIRQNLHKITFIKASQIKTEKVHELYLNPISSSI